MFPSVFISFKSTDRDLVFPLYEKMKKNGFSIFMSSEDIPVGEAWMARVSEELRQSKVLVAFVTKNYIADSYQVSRELSMADSRKIPIVSVIHGVGRGDIPSAWEYLFQRQTIYVRSLTDDAIENIISGCKDAISGKPILGKSAKDIYDEGRGFFEQDDYLSAAQCFEKASTDFPDAFPLLVHCRLILRQHEQARVAARDAQKYCPGNPDTYFFAALSNLAGRSDYSSRVLERASEQLVRAWEIEPHLKHCHLALCLAMLYSKRSFSIPQSILTLVQIGKKHEFDESFLQGLTNLLGI